MPAILFGSISTIADTSELQRQAFNRAFEAHGLGWHWNREEYLTMLEASGGKKRIAEYARSVGETVDANAVHQSKSAFFQQSLADAPPSPRPGVVETIQGAKTEGFQLGLVTTTSRDNISPLIAALSPTVEMTDFSIIVDSSSVARPKPDGAAYSYALDSLREKPDDCIAIEDNLQGVDAALAAGLKCIAFPNMNTAQHTFTKAQQRVDHLEFSNLQEAIRGE